MKRTTLILLLSCFVVSGANITNFYVGQTLKVGSLLSNKASTDVVVDACIASTSDFMNSYQTRVTTTLGSNYVASSGLSNLVQNLCSAGVLSNTIAMYPFETLTTNGDSLNMVDTNYTLVLVGKWALPEKHTVLGITESGSAQTGIPSNFTTNGCIAGWITTFANVMRGGYREALQFAIGGNSTRLLIEMNDLNNYGDTSYINLVVPRINNSLVYTNFSQTCLTADFYSHTFLAASRYGITNVVTMGGHQTYNFNDIPDTSDNTAITLYGDADEETAPNDHNLAYGLAMFAKDVTPAQMLMVSNAFSIYATAKGR
jgi:hypothetical protein